MKKIIFFDGYRLLQRAYYSLPASIQNKGAETNALIGFMHILKQQIALENPDYIGVVFGEETRMDNTVFKTYMQNDKVLSEALLQQTKKLQEMLEAMHITCYKGAVRSVDLLYTLVQSAIQESLAVQIVSGHEECLQLVSEQVQVKLPLIKEQKLTMTTFTSETIQESYGVPSTSLPAVKAIYTVAHESYMDKLHIGRASALTVMKQFQTIEGIYEHIDEVTAPRMKQYLMDAKAEIMDAAQFFLAKEVEGVALDLSQAGVDVAYTEKSEALFAQLGMPTQTKESDGAVPEQQKMVETYTWSYHVEVVKTIEQAEQIFKACDTGVTGMQILYLPAAKDTQMLSSASGQIYLQFEEKKENILGVAMVTAQKEDTVYWLSSQEGLSEDYLRQQLDQYAMYGKDKMSTFDIKTEYGQFLQQHLSQFSLNELTRMVDIKIAAYMLNPLKNDYQITDIAKEYLQLDMDSWQSIFGKADVNSAYQEHKEQVIDYYAKMAYVAQKTAGILEQRLVETDMHELFQKIEMPLTYVLFDMEQEGIAVDPDALKQYGDRLQVRITELEKIIYEKAGVEFNINSPKQLGEVLFEKLSLPGGKKTKTGYSTAADVLEKLSEEFPIVNDILEYRQLTKLKSTYADGLANYIDENSRIHTTFHQTITATGRLSSTEPNLQNIPMRMELGRLIRKVFLPKQDYLFMDADYSQIELRVLAHMSTDEKLIDAYHMSEDIHRITASQVFHTPFEEVTDLQRRNAKAVNFGIVYGISSFGLSQGLSISRKEASEYIERYFETYPGVKKFMDQLVSDAKISGYSESMFGRRRPIPEFQSSNYMQRQFGERVAMNAPIQGTAADIIKIAMVKVWEGLHEAHLKSKMILQIHDELLIETAPDEVEQVREILSTQMQEAAKLSVPLEIDLHVGKDWYEAK